MVFRGMEKVPESVMLGDAEEEEDRKWGGTLEVLGGDEGWENRVINIAGNHDIGYAGDIGQHRIERFENMFGKVNWDIVFKLPKEKRTEEEEDVPALRLVVLNSMNLDTPAYDGDLQRETYEFINHIITTSRSVTDKTHATILLTHIPLHKESGVCVDSPFFDFFEAGGVKEQNMLSEHSSKIVLESVFGLSSNQHAEGQGFGRRGIILNGHDHAGCDVLHYTTQPGVESYCPDSIDSHQTHLPTTFADSSTALSVEDPLEDSIAANETIPEPDIQTQEEQPPKWQAQRFPHLPYKVTENRECVALNEVPRIREVTLRSMMGDFSGYAGFLSAWFDPSLGEEGEWKLELNTCGLGVQHWWWGVHIVDLLLVVAITGGGVLVLFESNQEVASKYLSKHGEQDKKTDTKS